MNAVLFWPSVLVAVLFISAAMLKLLHLDRFLEQLAGYQIVPTALLRPVAALVIALELCAGLLTLVPSFHQIGCALLLGLLVVFTAVTAKALLAGQRELSCACFGAVSQRLTWAIPLRNLLLAAAAALGIPSGTSPLTAASVTTTVVALALAIVAIEAVRMFEISSEHANV